MEAKRRRAVSEPLKDVRGTWRIGSGGAVCAARRRRATARRLRSVVRSSAGRRPNSRSRSRIAARSNCPGDDSRSGSQGAAGAGGVTAAGSGLITLASNSATASPSASA